ncbi:MAG: hypothetical protein FWH24_01625 [Oscillospiraceae bacterium]|nr:hypothetical protein [Oscillospiraceae bacterium]
MSEQKILNYKNKPLTRQGNTICYGNSTDKYIMVMMILETAKVNDTEVATKVFVQIQGTRETEDKKISVVKFAEFGSLYEAFDAGEYWLNRELES